MNALMLLLLSIIPQPGGAYHDTVDVIEVNHLYGNDDGKWMYDQLIFWEWKGERFEVVDEYRMMKKVGELPVRDWQNGGYSLTWTEQQAIRHVHANSTRETWCLQMDDPEVAEREHLPKEKRRYLQKLPKPKPFVREFPPMPPPDND